MALSVAVLDDQIRETVNRLLDSMRGRLESEFSSCQEELIRTAHAANTEIAAGAAERATAQARREAEQQLTEVRESAARELDQQRLRLAAEIEELQRGLDEARGDASRQARESQQQIAAAREEIERLTKEIEEARAHLDATRDDVEATLRDFEALRRESETARNEVNRLTGQLRNSDAWALQARRLPDAVRALDDAGTFGDVLETLALRAGCEAGRAAVFLVKGDRLRDWRTVGFDFAADAPKLDIDVSDSGPMAEAVRSGTGIPPRTQHSVPRFARTDEVRTPAAWPVSVGGSVVAVLYADRPLADKSEEPYWPVFLDVLARHAGRVLEGITVRQAAGLTTGKATALASSAVGRQSSGSIR